MFYYKGLWCYGYATLKNFASAVERPVTYVYFRLTSSASMRAIHNTPATWYLAADGAIFENMLSAQLSVKVRFRL